MGIQQSVMQSSDIETDHEEEDSNSSYKSNSPEKSEYVRRDNSLGQNQYKSNGDSSETSLKILLFGSSIYKATKGLLQKLFVVFNYLRPRKAAEPSLPIQNPASTALSEPFLAPKPLICSRGASDVSSSHSILKITFGSLTYSSGGIDYEEAHECDRVSATDIRCSNEIIEEIAPQNSPCVEVNSSREEEREGEMKEQVKRSTVVVEKEIWIKHYSNRHKILLVGEGDFSFSACLAVAFGSAANIIATSLDSKAFLKKHYENAMSNIGELRSKGSKVMHGIDATEIAKHESLRQVKFDRIIFNFPYAGFFHKTSTECQLRRHRRLVSQFLMNAKKMISENGEIHISHKTNGFHAEFKVESIASSHGLRLIEAVKFKSSHYPGYNTKYGFGGDTNFNCNPSKTFKFALRTVSP